jgi:hypothetical protein
MCPLHQTLTTKIYAFRAHTTTTSTQLVASCPFLFPRLPFAHQGVCRQSSIREGLLHHGVKMTGLGYWKPCRTCPFSPASAIPSLRSQERGMWPRSSFHVPRSRTGTATFQEQFSVKILHKCCSSFRERSGSRDGNGNMATKFLARLEGKIHVPRRIGAQPPPCVPLWEEGMEDEDRVAGEEAGDVVDVL